MSLSCICVGNAVPAMLGIALLVGSIMPPESAVQYCPEMIKSSMDLIASGAGDAYIDCSEEEKRILFQDRFWNPTDKFVVIGALRKVLMGSVTAAGYPAIDVPAEMVAAAIAMLIRPANQFAACILMSETLVTVEEAASGAQFSDCKPAAPVVESEWSRNVVGYDAVSVAVYRWLLDCFRTRRQMPAEYAY